MAHGNSNKVALAISSIVALKSQGQEVAIFPQTAELKISDKLVKFALKSTKDFDAEFSH